MKHSQDRARYLLSHLVSAFPYNYLKRLEMIKSYPILSDFFCHVSHFWAQSHMHSGSPKPLLVQDCCFFLKEEAGVLCLPKAVPLYCVLEQYAKQLCPVSLPGVSCSPSTSVASTHSSCPESPRSETLTCRVVLNNHRHTLHVLFLGTTLLCMGWKRGEVCYFFYPTTYNYVNTWDSLSKLAAGVAAVN